MKLKDLEKQVKDTDINYEKEKRTVLFEFYSPRQLLEALIDCSMYEYEIEEIIDIFKCSRGYDVVFKDKIDANIMRAYLFNKRNN